VSSAACQHVIPFYCVADVRIPACLWCTTHAASCSLGLTFCVSSVVPWDSSLQISLWSDQIFSLLSYLKLFSAFLTFNFSVLSSSVLSHDSPFLLQVTMIWQWFERQWFETLILTLLQLCHDRFPLYLFKCRTKCGYKVFPSSRSDAPEASIAAVTFPYLTSQSWWEECQECVCRNESRKNAFLVNPAPKVRGGKNPLLFFVFWV